MLINDSRSGFSHPIPSEITPREVYESRRDMLKLLASGAAGTVLASWAARDAHAAVARPG